jgi:DNA mismatch repair ATPase MutS
MNVDTIAEYIPTHTNIGSTLLKERLSNPVCDPDILTQRRDVIRAIRSRVRKDKGLKDTILSHCQTLHDLEEKVNTVLNASNDTRHMEYYSQILWEPTSLFSWLNTIDWLSELVVFVRTIFLPGLSILLPIGILIMPFLIPHDTLSVEQYFSIIHAAIKKAIPSVLGKPQFAGKGGILEIGEQFVHIGCSVAMFVVSMWSQVGSSISMRAVVHDMRERAEAVRTFATTTRKLSELLGVSTSVDSDFDFDISSVVGNLALFGHAWNKSAPIQTLLNMAGNLDMIASIALLKQTCFPTIKASIQLTDLYHPGITDTETVFNSITMDSQDSPHVLLTGPNRGGKSTLLKSIGLAILMAQTVGVVFARKAVLPMFTNILTALSPQDIIGDLSLFESEIEFAKDVRSKLRTQTNTGPTFLMMDEIFHGTNAHDGVEASQVFLDDLYKSSTTNVFSIVSTHYLELSARYSKSKSPGVQMLCMDASIDPNDADRLVYTYKVKQGINSLSSVREILIEKGLLEKETKEKETKETKEKEANETKETKEKK